MKVTMYLFHNVVPKHEVTLKYCDKCRRPLFKYSADELVISNSGVTGFQIYAPGSKYIQIVCHSCQTPYDILFQ